MVGGLERIQRFINFRSGFLFCFKDRLLDELSFDSLVFVVNEFKLNFLPETGLVVFVRMVVFILFCDIL